MLDKRSWAQVSFKFHVKMNESPTKTLNSIHEVYGEHDRDTYSNVTKLFQRALKGLYRVVCSSQKQSLYRPVQALRVPGG